MLSSWHRRPSSKTCSIGDRLSFTLLGVCIGRGIVVIDKASTNSPCQRKPFGGGGWGQLGVYSVNACWRSGLGQDTISRCLALAGTPELVSIIETQHPEFIQSHGAVNDYLGTSICWHPPEHYPKIRQTSPLVVVATTVAIFCDWHYDTFFGKFEGKL